MANKKNRSNSSKNEKKDSQAQTAEIGALSSKVKTAEIEKLETNQSTIELESGSKRLDIQMNGEEKAERGNDFQKTEELDILSSQEQLLETEKEEEISQDMNKESISMEENLALTKELSLSEESEQEDETSSKKFHLPIAFWGVAFVFLGIFLFVFVQIVSNPPATEGSTYQRTPLPSGLAQGEINAGGSFFGNAMPELTQDLTTFYDETGIIPIFIQFYVVPGLTENPNFGEEWVQMSGELYYNASLQAYAFNESSENVDLSTSPEWFYKLLSPDESHLVIIYVVDYSQPTTNTYYWYYAGTSASTVFDDEAAAIFNTAVSQAWSSEDQDVATAIGNALVVTADEIMAPPVAAQNDSWIWLVGLGLVEIVALVGLGSFFWQREKNQAKM